MCDLWKNTLTETVPARSNSRTDRIRPPATPTSPPNQALQQRQLLRSSRNPARRPSRHRHTIASFERVIVECHPALIGENCFQFKIIEWQPGSSNGSGDRASPNPRQAQQAHDTEQFAAAAELLRKNDIDLRVFILVKPPFMREEEALEWAARSLDFAFDCGATAVTLIPTRGRQRRNGSSCEPSATSPRHDSPHSNPPPHMASALKRGRVFADLWDIEQARHVRIASDRASSACTQ